MTTVRTAGTLNMKRIEQRWDLCRYGQARTNERDAQLKAFTLLDEK